MKSHPVDSDLRLSACRRAHWRGWCLRLAAFVLLPLAVSAQTITSAVPGLISYQGKVTNANGTAVGAGTPVNRKVIFRIWSHQSNSTINDLVYSEEQTVTISEGEFSVLIGNGTAVTGTPLGYSESSKGPLSTPISSAAVFGGATRFLGVTVDDGSANADPEISPRQQLVTSAYAFRARYAESVGANGANSLIALDSGNVGIGATNPGARLEVGGNIRAGGAGVVNPQLQLLANHATNVAASIGYAGSSANMSTDAAATDTVFRTDNGGKLLLQTGAGASALAIDASNRVGIGTASPGAKLEVASTDSLNTAYISNTGGGGGTQPALRVKMAATSGARNVIQAENNSGSVFVVRDDGNVGVGSSSPAARLDVNGAIVLNPGFSNNTARPAVGTSRVAGEISGYSGAGTSQDDGFLRLSAGGGTNAGTKSFIDVTGYSLVADMHMNIRFGTAGTERMRIGSNGRVGIGTNAPAAPLHVAGWANVDTYEEARMDGFGAADVGNAFRSGMALGAIIDQTVRAFTYIVNSDARIKQVQGRSDGAADLATLLQVEITDYTYRDKRAHGGKTQKKVIAQQVERVFPQAVNQGTDVVPDIGAKATLDGAWIIADTDLKVGERVRLVGSEGASVCEVLEVQPGRFRAAFESKSNKVFVYGREVSDFRSVDYEAIAMLNVSATQELARENEALKKRIAELEARDHARDAKLAAIEKLLTSHAALAKPAAVTGAGEQQ